MEEDSSSLIEPRLDPWYACKRCWAPAVCCAIGTIGVAAAVAAGEFLSLSGAVSNLAKVSGKLFGLDDVLFVSIPWRSEREGALVFSGTEEALCPDGTG